MLKYTTYDIVFQEIPGETTLAINISNCPYQCPGCHSPELWEDIGEELTDEVFHGLIDKYPHITCVAIMGGDKNYKEVERLLVGYAAYMAWQKPNDKCLKTAWYSGASKLPSDMLWEYITYIKLGPYIKELGPLDNPNTNQRLYRTAKGKLIDITDKFWK